MKKLEIKKVFRDPLYGYIDVEYEIISKLIDTKEVQRLRRIRQLSGVSMVFQTAEHSRFTHALGAYHMANLVLKNVNGLSLNKYEEVLLLSSALLHDLGHGPYSHAFESVLSVKHEELSCLIILNENTEVNKILNSYDKNLAQDIAGVIRHSGKYKLIENFISSQLDVDRMDYLTRDAYFTGAPYGIIDYNRILRTMIVKNNKLYIKKSGIYSVESFLMSRYQMYHQVYYHPVTKAYELLLEGIYNRIYDLVLEKYNFNFDITSFIKVLKNNYDVLEYLKIDDAYVNGFIKNLINSNDKILNTLSNAFFNRKLFKYTDNLLDVPKNVINNKYYYQMISFSQNMYLVDSNNSSILVYDDNKELRLEDESVIISTLKNSKKIETKRYYYFEE